MTSTNGNRKIRCELDVITCQKKGGQPIFSDNCQDSFSLPFQRTWLFIYCKMMPGHWKTFLTWACCAVTLLTLRLGSGRYGNGDGESVLPSERNKLTKPVDCGENWPVEQLHRGTHRGPKAHSSPTCLPQRYGNQPDRNSSKKQNIKKLQFILQLIIQTHLASGALLT